MEISVNQNINKYQDQIKSLNTVEESKKIQIKEEALLDFSSMFKKNGFVKRPMLKLGAERKTQTQSPNWLLQIPAKLELTTSDFQQRRFMNQQKWITIKKTNFVQDCPIITVLSSINYLFKKNSPQTFSQLKLKDIKQKLQKSERFSQQLIRRQTILELLRLIKQEEKLSLEVQVHQLTQQGKNRQLLGHLIQGLKNTKKAFIYVCYGHVFCPIGYENTPLVPLDAYKKLNDIDSQKLELWLILASVLKTQAPFVIKRWSDIEKEMVSRWPQYLDLQQTKKGLQTWDSNKQNTDIKNQEISCWIQLTLTQNYS